MDFADRFRLRERYSHVKEYEDGMCLLDYLAGKFETLSLENYISILEENKIIIKKLN